MPENPENDGQCRQWRTVKVSGNARLEAQHKVQQHVGTGCISMLDETCYFAALLTTNRQLL